VRHLNLYVCVIPVLPPIYVDPANLHVCMIPIIPLIYVDPSETEASFRLQPMGSGIYDPIEKREIMQLFNRWPSSAIHACRTFGMWTTCVKLKDSSKSLRSKALDEQSEIPTTNIHQTPDRTSLEVSTVSNFTAAELPHQPITDPSRPRVRRPSPGSQESEYPPSSLAGGAPTRR